MIEYPSDYHFRLRFMLALRPEVLEYIIKTHSVSAEQSTLAQIRSACEYYEHSNEYGKQFAAIQTRLGGSNAPSAQDSPRAQHNIRGHLRPQQLPLSTQSCAHDDTYTRSTIWLHGEEQSRTALPRAMPRSDPKDKTETGAYTGSWFPHATDCPLEESEGSLWLYHPNHRRGYSGTDIGFGVPLLWPNT